ncbi:hypothetical protein ACJMK2_032750 [Sinanodonta woodiana]|uniref:Flavodoxin-like fold domain-containing protein n=1 Tax=Sinanodonta woodiana TaxID=1069815 RepID=A0ABD3X478_SINWO
MSAKRVLIIYAHQEPRSFNGAVKDEAVRTLKENGYDVEVSDLYAMQFDATSSIRQFKGKPENPDHYDFQRELRHANKEGTLPKDVVIELEKLASADLLILQFPMYWMNLPAILKGWLDRCLTEKFCFDTARGMWFDHGPFTAKKAMLSFTTGGTASYFSKRGVFGDMDVLLWPIHNTLRVCGFQILPPHILYAPNDVSLPERQKMLSDWSTRLCTVFAEKPLDFVHIDNFDVQDGFQLSQNYMEQADKLEFGPTAGQNLGKSFQISCQGYKTESVVKNNNDEVS